MMIRGISFFILLSTYVLGTTTNNCESPLMTSLIHVYKGEKASIDPDSKILSDSDWLATPNQSRQTSPKSSPGLFGKVCDAAASLRSSLSGGLTPPTTPIKESHSEETLASLLSSSVCNALQTPEQELAETMFNTPLPPDLKSLMGHPTIAAAIATSCHVYQDSDLHKKHPTLDVGTVAQYLEKVGLKAEELADGLMLFVNETTKEAWFAIRGTDGPTRALTSLGIGSVFNLSEYDQALKQIWGDFSFVDATLTSISALQQLNSYFINFITQVNGQVSESVQMLTNTLLLTQFFCYFGKPVVKKIANYAFDSLNLIKAVCWANYGAAFYAASQDNMFYTLFAMGCLSSGIILHANAIPRLCSRRYKNHIMQLHSKIKDRIDVLEKKGFGIRFSGHSLGGHQAKVLGLLFGKPAFSFNAPGGALAYAHWLHQFFPESRMPLDEDYKRNILDVVTEGDPISALECNTDPLNPVKVRLNGVSGLRAHTILPTWWASQTAAQAAV